MSKTKSISVELVPSSPIPSVKLDALADRVNAYHEGVQRSIAQQMGYAFLAGVELNKAKALLPHGQFEKWRRDNLPQLKESTAQVYKSFATKLQSHSSKLANLLPAPESASSAVELSDDQRTEILKAVHDVTDGKSLTEMYRDLGVIRQPKTQKERDNSKKATPEEAEEALNAQANELYQQALNVLAAIEEDTDAQKRVLPDFRRQLIARCITCSKRERAFLKSEKKPARKTKKG